MTESKSQTNRASVTKARSTPLPRDGAPSNVAFLLSQVGAFASQNFVKRLAELDLQPPLFRVMNAIDAAEGLSQQAIGDAIQAPPSRMVAIVDELERRALVERRRQPDDRRAHALHLTAKGRQLLGRGRRIAAVHEKELTKGMSKAERERLVSLLQIIVAEQEIGPGVHPALRDDGTQATR